jgi:hypothetical protein
MAVRIIISALIVVSATACDAMAACPSSVEQLHDPDLRARLGGSLVAGTAIVQRYVDSPDAEYRGYDLEIRTRVAGLAQSDQIMFASATEPLPGIEPGDEVMVIGRRGPRVAEIRAADCPLLKPVRSP